MTRVMGILNTTPDSFSDGGLWTDRDSALRQAVAMVEAGADIIDVGGESTRPGSKPVSAGEELDRVIPVVDTSKPEVMKEAIRAGAGMINDVFALRLEGAVETAASLAVPVCLMHMLGEPRTMQGSPEYEDVVDEVEGFLQQRADACIAAGIPPDRIVIDPGFGFGKTLDHNLTLFRSLPRLCRNGFPLLVGISRKSMLGALTGKPVEDRLAASVTAAVLAARLGAAIVRVHDVAETVDALKVALELSPIETGPVRTG
jgi:dihydropteroate synthase